MKKFSRVPFAIILFVLFKQSAAQNTRLNTYNTIGWYNYFGTFKLSDKWGIHTEYQWRRSNIVTSWQQSLLRAGVNFKARPNLLLRAGYAWAETFSYGDIPLNSYGKQFTEHRVFEMLQLSQREGRFDIINRFMLEQRFVGRYTSSTQASEVEFPLLHRGRYMVRVQLPLNKTEIANKTLYIAAYDEIFIGFGQNVNANVFDQNRIGALFGYQFNSAIRIELGYLNQVAQYSRLVNSRNVFQHNNGIILNASFNFALHKEKT